VSSPRFADDTAVTLVRQGYRVPRADLVDEDGDRAGD
jgi:hypothetical protein